jgi:pimeloyl-ACP methyl ester carboxylesterase
MKIPFGCFSCLTIALAHVALPVAAYAQSSVCSSRPASDGTRVDEAGFVPLGGIEQFVTVRGDNRSNPVLLHVHGGPGMAFSAFTADFAPYEADFTVVQWDQRGSGCTFGRHGEATPEITLDRLARDGLELAGYLRARFGGRKIIVLGHSFGSIVATDMVRRAPEHFVLYVGTGQFASFVGSLEAQLAYLRRLATGNADLTSELDALATLDPQSVQKFGGVNRVLQSRLPAGDIAWMQGLQSRAAKIMAPKELADWQAGRQASGGRLITQIARVDLFVAARRFEVPFVVIQGSDDLITPTAVARAYFEQVQAPAKELVIVDGAGHFAHVTHTAQFLSALREQARRAISR